jgi:hypothetical protein
MRAALGTPEPSVVTRVTRRNIPEDGTIHSNRRENLKSYIIIYLLWVHTWCSMIINQTPIVYTDRYVVVRFEVFTAVTMNNAVI